MTGWIGASDSQRFNQYTKPAARAELSRANKVVAELRSAIKQKLLDRLANSGRSFTRRRIENRSVKSAIRDLRSYNRQIEWLSLIVSTPGAKR